AAVSTRPRNRAQDFRNAGMAAEMRSSAHPERRSKPEGARVKRGGPVSRPSAIASSAHTTSAPARHGHAVPGTSSAAAGGDEGPVWIVGSGIACKGPVVGLLDRLVRVAVDDATVHRASHIDLLGDHLGCYPSRAPFETGFHDVCAVEPQDSCIERLFGSDP